MLLSPTSKALREHIGFGMSVRLSAPVFMCYASIRPGFVGDRSFKEPLELRSLRSCYQASSLDRYLTKFFPIFDLEI